MTRHTQKRQAVATALVEELSIGAALRLKCDSDDINSTVRAVVEYIMDEYRGQEFYIPSTVTWPVEQLREALASKESVRSICRRFKIDRRTLYRVVSDD